MKTWASWHLKIICVISVKRPWVWVPIWVLAGFESWHMGSSSNLSCMLSVSIRLEYYLCCCLLSCVQLWDPVDCRTPGFPVLHCLPEFAQTHVHWVMMPSSRLILCRPLLLLPSIFPSIKVYPNELVLRIRWPKYWSFSFIISPSNEYSGFISFRTDRFDLSILEEVLSHKLLTVLYHIFYL